MSWGAVIAGGAALAGSVISSASSRRASRQANLDSQQSLEFARQQYNDFKATYGPIESNLSAYYSNLSPDYFATIGLEQFEKERQNDLTSMSESLATRGIESSGVAAELRGRESIDAASQRAQIRRSAQDQVAQRQQGFLAVGMGSNATNNLQSTLNNNTAYSRNIANQSAQAAGQAAGQAFSVIGSTLQRGITSYLDRPSAAAPITGASDPYDFNNFLRGNRNGF